ncbi:type IV secretion system protein [Novosphingobium sp. 9]|uniref:type IV secretion system protein n=1 Tax=Novosphingobium sp. 9 TaxID=2025349 RepID=UPI0021B5987B|nr:type IV secretion system protein [Novosphingobium sp. 9]
MADCKPLIEVASTGVGPALRAVDCVSGETTAAAFGRLFGAHGSMAPVLTILLTLYIAFFAFSLITGRSRIGISALTPRMLTLGLVLTFATSWLAYQTLFWNLAVGGPDWIASLLTDTRGSAIQMFGDRIDIVFDAVAQIAQGQQPQGADGAAAGAPAAASAAASGGAGGLITPETILWAGAIELLLGTVGVLLTARIALAILMALGPVFVVMALFGGTRGLTAGWLRGVVLTAITPLFVVLGGMVSLELLVPIISALATNAQMGGIDARSAMAFFLVASVHVALMVMVFKVAGTMVMGWNVFGLARSDGERSGGGIDLARLAAASSGAGIAPASGAGAATAVPSRTSAMATAAATPQVVVEAGQGGGAATGGDRRTHITQVSGGGIEPLTPRGSEQRAKGIGSRFRSPSNDTGRKPSREISR